MAAALPAVSRRELLRCNDSLGLAVALGEQWERWTGKAFHACPKAGDWDYVDGLGHLGLDGLKALVMEMLDERSNATV